MKSLRLYKIIDIRSNLFTREDRSSGSISYIKIIFRYNRSFELSPIVKENPHYKSRADYLIDSNQPLS